MVTTDEPVCVKKGEHTRHKRLTIDEPETVNKILENIGDRAAIEKAAAKRSDADTVLVKASHVAYPRPNRPVVDVEVMELRGIRELSV